MSPKYRPKDFNSSPIPDAGNNPQDAAHLSDIPYDKTPIGAVLNEDTPVDPEQLKALQDGKYWSDRPPARELPTQPEAPKKPSHMGRNITLGLAAVSVAAGGLFGIHAANDGNKTETLPPEPTPNASAPVTPGAQESASPTPSATPTPEQTTPTPETGISSGKAAEFNMTDAEYQKVVDSFKISRSANPTPQSAIAAFNKDMTGYFAFGHTTDNETRYLSWSTPNVSQPGWNSWATEVATSAIETSMFDTNYNQTVGNYIDTMKGLKTQANRMWVNANDMNHSDGFALTFEFVPIGGITMGNGGFIANGTITYTDNAANFGATATDSHAVGSYSLEDQSVAMAPKGDEWVVTRLVAGLPVGK